jgi:adenylyltransferase/sulfurtransferase
MPATTRDADPLTDGEARRYARHLVLPQIGAAGQQRLKQARVLVIGAGGLGSPALLYLAAAGIGTLGVVDDDLVDESNLHRQVAHRHADVGRPKVDSARDTIAGLNPLVDVVVHEFRLDATNAEPLLRAYDVVVDGSDNFATRYVVSDACARLGIACVWGSVEGFEGQVSVSWPPHGPCYRCLYPQPPEDDAATCGSGGVLGTVCATIGAAQATEVLKLLLGIGWTLSGRLLLYDGLTAEQRVLRVEPDPQCPACGQAATAATATAATATAATATAVALVAPADLESLLEDGAILVDVREPDELVGPPDGPPLAGARRVPASEFATVAPEALLPRDGTIVLVCRYGPRSSAVGRLLLAAGFADVRSLDGGTLAWQNHRRSRSGGR